MCMPMIVVEIGIRQPDSILDRAVDRKSVEQISDQGFATVFRGQPNRLDMVVIRLARRRGGVTVVLVEVVELERVEKCADTIVLVEDHDAVECNPDGTTTGRLVRAGLLRVLRNAERDVLLFDVGVGQLPHQIDRGAEIRVRPGIRFVFAAVGRVKRAVVIRHVFGRDDDLITLVGERHDIVEFVEGRTCRARACRA